MVRPAAGPRVQYPNSNLTGDRPKPANTNTNQGANGSALAGAGAMAIRREFNHMPLRTSNALTSYGNLTADQLAGPDDIRLRQLNRAATRENVTMTRRLSAAARNNGVNAHIYGRAKDPFSTFGKLREAPGTTIKSIKDMSGMRMDINPSQPGFSEYYRAQGAAEDTFGSTMKLKQDYIKNPNRWGYTGRIHHHIASGNGLTHELQIGSRDLSQFIDKKLVTAGGDSIKLHDATGYKGQIYGVKVPKHLEGQYTQLMGDITEANRSGKSLAQVPKLQAQVDDFYKQVEAGLPDKLNKPPPPTLSKGAKVRNIAGKGMGALGVVGGGFQVAGGIEELKQGKNVEGSADILAGSGSVVSGAALMTGRIALGTTTGGAVAVVDGAKDLYVGVRDGNVEKAATGGVKTAAGGAMIAGVATANPVLIAGGAIAYGGAVIYENRDAIYNAGKSAVKWLGSWF